MEPERLLERIRQKLAAQILPRNECERTWYGPGRGRPCAACDEMITSLEIEVECDLPDGSTIRLHRQCLEGWQQAWRSAAPA